MKTNVAKERLLLVYIGLFLFISVLAIGLFGGNDWLFSVRNAALAAVVGYFLMKLFLRLYYQMLNDSLEEKAQEIEEKDDTSP